MVDVRRSPIRALRRERAGVERRFFQNNGLSVLTVLGDTPSTRAIACRLIPLPINVATRVSASVKSNMVCRRASGLKPSFGFNVHDLQQDPHAAIGRVLPHLMTGTANAAKI